MTDRTYRSLIILALATGLPGCNSTSPTSPTQPAVSNSESRPTSRAPCNGANLVGVTLFGVVSEVTASGPVPVAGVTIYCDACGEFGHGWAETDANGYYSFGGDLSLGGGIWASARPIPLHVSKQGYTDPVDLPQRSECSPSGAGWREVTIDGDTRFDMQLVRQ